jgi:hypothetical protein
MTSQGSYKLRIDIEDFSGDSRYVVYDVFMVGDETSQYLLYVGGLSGNVVKMFNSIIRNKTKVSRTFFFCLALTSQ